MSDQPQPGPDSYAFVEPEPTIADPSPVFSSSDAKIPEAPVSTRLLSLDAYRGFVMLAMASGGLGMAAVSKNFPESDLWRFLATQTEHVAWRGCTFWDLIQPSFIFMVGVAMPWAYANRTERGQGWWGQFGHVLGRALVLILLGLFLVSNSSKQTNWNFMNVLTQIGLGYPFVFLVLRWRPWAQFLAAIAILIGYWAFFAFWPLPGTGGTWPTTPTFDTLLIHWAKNANAASDFDAQWLAFLPYPDGAGFKVNPRGYTTLNFIPCIATAIFGVMVGGLLKKDGSPREKLGTLMVAGVIGITVGTIMDYTVCLSVKRIWTPAWVLVSTGWACVLMAIFYLIFDVIKLRRLALPMVVVGANSIVMYVMAQLMTLWITQSLRIHLTTLTFVFDHWLGFGPSVVPKIERDGPIFSGPHGPIYDAVAVLFVLWLICLWLYRRKLFVRI